MSNSLYEQDFFRWSEQQARTLRDAASLRVNVPLDWENLAEEIESLGRSQRTELGSRILLIVEHLMKLQASPATAPRRGWRNTVLRERALIERLLDDSPSLRITVPGLIVWATPQARRIVANALAARNQRAPTLAALDYTEEQVLGDWLP